jgi:hypothetical protein
MSYRPSERVRRLRERCGGLRCPHCGGDVPPPVPKRIELIEVSATPPSWGDLLRLATDGELEDLERITDALHQ